MLIIKITIFALIFINDDYEGGLCVGQTRLRYGCVDAAYIAFAKHGQRAMNKEALRVT
jgi:hypothetical protein